MKRAVLLIIVYFVTAHWLVFGQEHRDKLLHFSASAIGQVACVSVVDQFIEDLTTSNILCALGVTTAGVMTEAGAFGQNDYELMDIAANTAGVGLGALIVEFKF